MPAFILKANRDRNRSFDKMTLPQLEARLAAHERIQAISTQIRERVGLPPVPENAITEGVRGRLAMLQAKAVKPKVKRAKVTDVLPLTPEQELDAIKAAREKRRAAEQQDSDRIAVLARSRALPVAQIAARVGVSPQAIYQLAA